MGDGILTAPVDLVEAVQSRRRTAARPSAAPLVLRIAGEYGEMPGMSLTLTQAARFLGVDRRTCEAALQVLVARGDLEYGEDGRYRNAGDLRCAWRRAG